MRRIELATESARVNQAPRVSRKSRTLNVRDVLVFTVLVAALLCAAWYSRTDPRPLAHTHVAAATSTASVAAVAMR